MKRIGNSFKGILAGIILVIGGIVLLWWNEGNNVRNLKTTAEMEKTYVDVKSDVIDPANEDKLIATYGKVGNEEELTDSTFAVTVKTPLLRRVVEVYQWVEESETDEDGDTRYTYKKEWSTDIINSGDFHQSGHDNPAQKLYSDAEYASSKVTLGAFTLSSNQVYDMSTEGIYTDFNTETLTGLGLTVSGNYVTNSKDLTNPAVGDVRISFVYNNTTDLSVLAVQKGDSFVDFVSSAGKRINRLWDGIHSGEEIINQIKAENKLIKWLLRLAGTVLCIAGFAAILKPISAITSYIPILGSIVGAAVGLVALVLGLCVSLLIIAVAWLRYRPLLGIGLIAVVVVLIVLLSMRKKNKVETPAPVQQ